MSRASRLRQASPKRRFSDSTVRGVRTGLSRQLLSDPIDNTTIPIPAQDRIARVSDSAFSSASVVLVTHPSGRLQGVLVHFNESSAIQAPVTLPWIAMISCDTNGTTYSLVDDIFTLARDHGAQAALLYSLTAQVGLYVSIYEDPRTEAWTSRAVPSMPSTSHLPLTSPSTSTLPTHNKARD